MKRKSAPCWACRLTRASRRLRIPDRFFLAHADRASQLPGVDLSRLTTEQKQAALHRFNAEGCSCGCKFTLAQCRIYDRNCPISKGRTLEIIEEVSSGVKERAAPPETPAGPSL